MDTSEKPLTASIRHIARFLKSGRPIYNLEVPNTDGRKSRITQATKSVLHLAQTQFLFYEVLC